MIGFRVALSYEARLGMGNTGGFLCVINVTHTSGILPTDRHSQSHSHIPVRREASRLGNSFTQSFALPFLIMPVALPYHPTPPLSLRACSNVPRSHLHRLHPSTQAISTRCLCRSVPRTPLEPAKMNLSPREVSHPLLLTTAVDQLTSPPMAG